MKNLYFWTRMPAPSDYSDRQAWEQEFGAASMYTAPMHSKGMALGTLTVGSSSPDAFAGCEGSHHFSECACPPSM